MKKLIKRPITLLYFFFKLVSGCRSYKIKSTLDTLIAKTQTGFIKDRFSDENTRFIYNLLAQN